MNALVMKPASNYTITHVAPTAVFLVDNDVGRSVTNDAENVVAAVAASHPNRRIFCKDTMGCWDELVHNNGTFLRFAGIAPVSVTRYKEFLT